MTVAEALKQLTLATPYVGDAGSPERRAYLEAVEAVTRALEELEAAMFSSHAALQRQITFTETLEAATVERCARVAERVKVRGMRAGHVSDNWDICCSQIADRIRALLMRPSDIAPTAKEP